LSSEPTVPEKLEDDPYYPAIQSISGLSGMNKPSEKLNSILKMMKEICECVSKFQKNEARKSTIGADQLLPLMCYVLVKANVPFIYSEVNLLSDFINEQNVSGELGYTLASIQTCLEYLVGVTRDDIKRNEESYIAQSKIPVAEATLISFDDIGVLSATQDLLTSSTEGSFLFEMMNASPTLTANNLDNVVNNNGNIQLDLIEEYKPDHTGEEETTDPDESLPSMPMIHSPASSLLPSVNMDTNDIANDTADDIANDLSNAIANDISNAIANDLSNAIANDISNAIANDIASRVQQMTKPEETTIQDPTKEIHNEGHVGTSEDGELDFEEGEEEALQQELDKFLEL